MPDLDTQIRSYFEATTRPIDVDELLSDEPPVTAPMPGHRSSMHGLLVAAAVAVVTAITLAAVFLLPDSDTPPVAPPTTGNTQPRPTTTLPPSTTLPPDQAAEPVDPQPTAVTTTITVLPSSLGNGVVAFATQWDPSPVYLVRAGEIPRPIIPSEGSLEDSVVCPAFSPDGTMLAVGMPGGSIVVLPIDASGEVGNARRLPSLASETHHCPTWAPDGSAVAFLDPASPLSESAVGGVTLEIDPLVGEPRRIAGWEADGGSVDHASFSTSHPPDRAVQWSPDGSTIAVARPSGTWLVPVDGAAPRRLDQSPANTVSWSPDGTRLVVWTPRGTLVISASDGDVEATLPPGRQPVWSPRGDRIAYTDDKARIVVVDPDGADPQVVSDYGYNPTWSPDGTQLMYIHDAGGTGGIGYALMSQTIDADGNRVGNAVTVVPTVQIANGYSFPNAQSFSWQPVPQSAP